MEYKGKLYGKLGHKYFDTAKTSEDWDKMEDEIKLLKEQLNTKKLCGTCKYFRAEKNYCICIGQHAQHDFGCVYHDCL